MLFRTDNNGFALHTAAVAVFPTIPLLVCGPIDRVLNTIISIQTPNTLNIHMRLLVSDRKSNILLLIANQVHITERRNPIN
jgi:hypothetical protein